MALDATVAGAAANSYLTRAEADSIIGNSPGSDADAWRKAAVDTKEWALQRATEEIDLSVDYVVHPYTVQVVFVQARQKLLFPRAEDVDPVTSQPFIHDRVRTATAIQAAFLIRNATVLDDAAAFRARGLSNFSNPDGTSGTLSDNADFGRLHPRAMRLLGGLSEGAVIARIVTT